MTRPPGSMARTDRPGASPRPVNRRAPVAHTDDFGSVAENDVSDFMEGSSMRDTLPRAAAIVPMQESVARAWSGLLGVVSE